MTKIQDIPGLGEFLSTATRPLIVILGPTASGKTSFSINLSSSVAEIRESPLRGRTVEIVNADSRQLYRHLTIGTAKITKEEMQGIPHHLFDVLDPKEEVTAAWYKEKASRVIDDIHFRKNIPVLTGGSMLYISAIIDGLDFPELSDEALRLELSRAYDRDEGKALHAELTAIDPQTAAGIPRQNKPYLIRALELHRLSGKKPSSLRKISDCPYDLFIIGIERPREDIVRRINERTTQLLEAGWIEEVQDLLKKGYGPNDPGLKSHGYREIVSFLQTGTPSRKELTESIASQTRQYAKRQMTWWRNDERIRWMISS